MSAPPKRSAPPKPRCLLSPQAGMTLPPHRRGMPIRAARPDEKQLPELRQKFLRRLQGFFLRVVHSRLIFPEHTNIIPHAESAGVQHTGGCAVSADAYPGAHGR